MNYLAKHYEFILHSNIFNRYFSWMNILPLLSHFLLQGLFLTQGLNPGPLHCRQIVYHISHLTNAITGD